MIGLEGKGEGKRTALPRPTGYAQLAVVGFDDALGNRQPQSRAIASAARLRVPDLSEFIENPLLVFWRDADSIVLNADFHLAEFGMKVDANNDGPPRRGKFQRIAHQVDQYLLDALGIKFNPG